METIFESKKLELIYEGVGEEKARKQNFGNIKEDTTNEDLAGFASLMGQLAPVDLTAEEVKAVMDGITELHVFEKQGTEMYVESKSAKYTETIVTELF